MQQGAGKECGGLTSGIPRRLLASDVFHLTSNVLRLTFHVFPFSLFRFIHQSTPKNARTPMTSRFAKRLRFFPT